MLLLMFENEYLLYLSNLCLHYISCIILWKNQVENVCIKYDENSYPFLKWKSFFFLHILCKGLTDS